MRFRLGMIIGFGAGYWFGTAAGRQRHEQLQRMVDKARATETFETVSDKAKAVVDISVERARDFVDEHVPGNGTSVVAPPEVAPDTTTTIASKQR
jgi:hypothetical protein